MTRRVRLLSLALACALAGAAPAGAASNDPAAKRAEAAKRLDALQATDDELAEAADVLDTALGSAVRKAATARREADEADLRVADAEAQQKAVERVVSERAVATYTARGQVAGIDLVGSATANDSVRRLALQRYVDARLTDALDELRASRADLTRRRNAAKAKAKAASRALTDVTAARSNAVKARTDLSNRIKQVQGEIAALEGEQAAVERIIAAQPPTPVRAVSAAAPAPGGGGGRVSASGYAWPMNGGRTTSEFGPRWGRMHQGLDIAAPTGTPLLASKAGKVIFAGWQGGYGNFTMIDHGGGFVTAYGHQSRLGASAGTEVAQRQVIGYVGSTGHSTGPHLHFEVRVNGRQQNPRNYLP